MDFKIGQVWSVTWIQGSEVLPSHGRTLRVRTAILTGAEAVNGAATTLHFSLPMIEGRRNNSVSASELLDLHASGKAELLGQLVIDPPDEEEPEDQD